MPVVVLMAAALVVLVVAIVLATPRSLRDALDKVNWQEVAEALRVMAAIMSTTGSTCTTVSGR